MSSLSFWSGIATRGHGSSAESEDLKNIMEAAGVVSRPDIYYLDSAGTTSA